MRHHVNLIRVQATHRDVDAIADVVWAAVLAVAFPALMVAGIIVK